MRKFLYYNNNRHPIQSLEQITHRSVTLSTESATILVFLFHPVHILVYIIMSDRDPNKQLEKLELQSRQIAMILDK